MISRVSIGRNCIGVSKIIPMCVNLAAADIFIFNVACGGLVAMGALKW